MNTNKLNEKYRKIRTSCNYETVSLWRWWKIPQNSWLVTWAARLHVTLQCTVSVFQQLTENLIGSGILMISPPHPPVQTRRAKALSVRRGAFMTSPGRGAVEVLESIPPITPAPSCASTVISSAKKPRHLLDNQPRALRWRERKGVWGGGIFTSFRTQTRIFPNNGPETCGCKSTVGLRSLSSFSPAGFHATPSSPWLIFPLPSSSETFPYQVTRHLVSSSCNLFAGLRSQPEVHLFLSVYQNVLLKLLPSTKFGPEFFLSAFKSQLLRWIANLSSYSLMLNVVKWASF